MGYQEEFSYWLENDYFDQDTKKELLAIRNDKEEIEDRFYRDLEFGTGGLRGVAQPPELSCKRKTAQTSLRQ